MVTLEHLIVEYRNELIILIIGCSVRWLELWIRKKWSQFLMLSGSSKFHLGMVTNEALSLFIRDWPATKTFLLNMKKIFHSSAAQLSIDTLVKHGDEFILIADELLKKNQNLSE